MDQADNMVNEEGPPPQFSTPETPITSPSEIRQEEIMESEMKTETTTPVGPFD